MKFEAYIFARYWQAGLPPLPDVMFRPVELGRYSGHADAWSWGSYMGYPLFPLRLLTVEHRRRGLSSGR